MAAFRPSLTRALCRGVVAASQRALSVTAPDPAAQARPRLSHQMAREGQCGRSDAYRIGARVMFLDHDVYRLAAGLQEFEVVPIHSQGSGLTKLPLLTHL